MAGGSEAAALAYWRPPGWRVANVTGGGNVATGVHVRALADIPGGSLGVSGLVGLENPNYFNQTRPQDHHNVLSVLHLAADLKYGVDVRTRDEVIPEVELMEAASPAKFACFSNSICDAARAAGRPSRHDLSGTIKVGMSKIGRQRILARSDLQLVHAEPAQSF